MVARHPEAWKARRRIHTLRRPLSAVVLRGRPGRGRQTAPHTEPPIATYAIGDVQGCYAELRALVAKLPWDPARDRLWFVGDLVNRGPGSLDVLRWVRDLGDAAVTVLGNHDLHLLGVWLGTRQLHPGDTLTPVLEAPDGETLLRWLRGRPLLHVESPPGGGTRVLAHAGLHPAWSLGTAQAEARALEETLRGPGAARLLAPGRPRGRARWRPRPRLRGLKRQRVALAALTRMRALTPRGRLDLRFKGPMDQLPPGRRAWFDVPRTQGPALGEGLEVVFGHWAALGFYRRPGVWGLDSGCVWGGALTAVRLEDGARFQEPARRG